MILAQTFWMKFVSDSFLQFGPIDTSTTFQDLIIALFWSLLLSWIIALTYRSTHQGLSYSQHFTQILLLFGMVVSIIMMIVATTLVRAFTLIGAFSIIRFRTALKDTRDLAFLFFVMVEGMVVGTRFYSVAILLTLIGCLLMFTLTFLHFGRKRYTQDIFECDCPKSYDYLTHFIPIFKEYLRYYSLVGIDVIDDTYNRISFLISLKSHITWRNIFRHSIQMTEKLVKKEQFLHRLQELPELRNIRLLEGTHASEI